MTDQGKYTVATDKIFPGQNIFQAKGSDVISWQLIISQGEIARNTYLC